MPTPYSTVHHAAGYDPERCDGSDDDGRERLVDLGEVDVVDRQAVALQQSTRQVSVSTRTVLLDYMVSRLAGL